MNKLFFGFALLATFLWVEACSDDANPNACQTSSLIGTWTLAGGIVATFNTDCSWTTTKCNHVGTYENVTAQSGSVEVNVTSVSPDAGMSGCVDEGEHTCTYAISGETLAYACQ